MTQAPSPSSLFCTKCGAQASSADVFCARCGTKLSTNVASSPQAAQPKPKRKLKEDLAQIRSAGFWVALFITLPTLSLPTLIVSLLEPGDLGIDEATSIWNILVLTAPLTVATIVMIVALHYDWFDNGWFFTLFGAGLLAATTLLADLLSIGGVIDVGEVWRAVGYQPFNFFEGMLVRYYEIYGFWSFASSLVVGGFIAWIWIEKIMPYLAKPQ